MPLTLIAAGVGFVCCCIYSTVAVHFFFGTVDTHTPYTSVSIFSPHLIT